MKKNTYKLPYDTLTLLSGKPKSAGLKKKENRGEKELRAPEKITPSGNVSGKLLVTISFILSSKMFQSFRLLRSRNFFITARYCLRRRVVFAYVAIILEISRSFFLKNRSIFTSGNASSHSRYKRKYRSQ
jgi:hypothetical protein